MGKLSVLCLTVFTLMFFSRCEAIVRNTNCRLANAVFSIISKYRLNNEIIETNENVDRSELCVKNCVWNDACKSINYNKNTKVCELLRTKFRINKDNEKIEKTDGWHHYEDSENERNIGPTCQKLQPCGDGACVDTCDSLGYTCRCEKNNGTIRHGKCISPSMNICSQMQGVYENEDITINITRTDEYAEYATPTINIQTAGSSDIVVMGSHLNTTTCKNGTWQTTVSAMSSFPPQSGFISHDYKTCRLVLVKPPFTHVAYRKDCGYLHCKKLAGVYDKGKVLSSLFGIENGLQVMLKENGLKLVGYLFQVESSNPKERCRGYVSADLELVEQPDNCKIVWKYHNGNIETWTKQTAECTTTKQNQQQNREDGEDQRQDRED